MCETYQMTGALHQPFLQDTIFSLLIPLKS